MASLQSLAVETVSPGRTVVAVVGAGIAAFFLLLYTGHLDGLSST